MILVLLLLIFIIGEILSRLFVGNRLIVKVEENGLYHFNPNQNGWYTHIIDIPHARINNIGARGEDIDISLLKSTKKYIFLGDSFTFGWDLEDTQTIPFYFSKQESFKENTVLNYANGGFGLDHMTATYDFYNHFFVKNDTIVMIILEDDLYREMTPYNRSLIKERFWQVKEKSSFISWIWANFRHISVAVQKQSNQIQDKDIFTKKEQKLLDFKNNLKNDNINIVYVFYEYNHTSYSDKASNFCKKNNLACITNIYDSIKEVKNAKKNIYTIDNAHPSNESNLAVAKQIVNFINKNKI